MARLKVGAVHRTKQLLDLNYTVSAAKKAVIIAEHMVWLNGRLPSQAISDERSKDGDGSPLDRWMKSTKIADRCVAMRRHMGQLK